MTLFAERPAGSDLEARLALSDVRRLRGILRSASDAFIGMNSTGLVTEWNDAAERIFGWRREDALGRSVAELIIPQRLRAAHDAAVQHFVDTGEGSVLGKPVHTQAIRKDGTEFPVELTRWALEDDGAEREFYAFIRDISARAAAEFAADHDALTGLANTSLMVRRMESGFAAPDGSYRPALIVMDVDRFKRANEEFGRAVGDEILRRLGDRLVVAVRDHAGVEALVARLSGDQFAILLDTAPAAADLTQLLDDVMAAPGRVAAAMPGGLILTSSVGYCDCAGNREYDVESVMRDARTALSRAQRIEGNSSVAFDDELGRQGDERRTRVHELAVGIEKGQLEVHYQPIFALASGEMAGAEALVRWRHPKHGLLAPAQFIGIAEETGLIIPLGRWVLGAVCRQLASWQDDPDLGGLRVAVNFSAHQFADSDPVADVTRALADAGVEDGARRLTIEVTESVLIHRPRAVAAALAGLRALGAAVAIDDFGTGFSSLNYLKELPLDVIKIDKAFVDGVPDSRADRAIVISTIALAHELGFTAIAEGVESDAQATALRAYGADSVQGFLFAKPQPAATLERLVAARRSPGGA